MYQIENKHPKLERGQLTDGEIHIVAPGFKFVVIVPYSVGADNSSAALPRPGARELANDILIQLQTKDYANFKPAEDCTGALTRDWAERAAAGATA